MNYIVIGMILMGAFTEIPDQEISKNSAPFFVSKEKTRVNIDSAYTYQFAAADSAGNQIHYNVRRLPDWLSYSSTDHAITGKPLRPGQYPVEIIAANGKSKTSQNFMITVFDDQTINILAIGNSITNGTDKYNSYRRPLWKMLHKANYNFDFIGSWSKHHMGGEVPDPDFDMDHEGHSGWNFEHVFNPPDWDVKRGNINAWLQSYTPDLVLLELGTNDVFQCRSADDILKNMLSLIDLLRSKNNDMKIFISTIPPLGREWSDQNLCGRTYRELLAEANKRISDFARLNSTPRSSLILVDQFSGINPQMHLYDDIHPNTLGEEIMAQKWFEVIRSYLVPLKK